MTSLTRSRIRTLIGAVALLPFLASPALSQSSTGEDKSLYERLGGLPAISLVVSDFMDDFIADPVIMANPSVRERKTPDAAPYIKFQVTTLVCQLTGGPCEYTGLDMREAHDGLAVTAEEWDRMGAIFAETLASHAVPERETEELFALLGPTRDDIVVVDRD